ncbi:MAG: DNA-directed RNA polymerase subunit D [Candidatus Diapherotrites archaeon CG08_land_8_20_14_0_20_30_16]|nr:MAG: DNA-directed RNA polymerase subunit D [Candidatus Diapherotrites archaeon CG08_land_8_20_14_0_20_30_16]
MNVNKFVKCILGERMLVKFLNKDSFDYKFLLQNTRNDLVNAIRRTILLHVPVFAVKEVSVYKNESVMPDELLSHRIGLVPIYTDDVDNNDHHLYLKKTGSTVYSGDITGNLEIPLKNIPLVVLNDNKTIELEFLVNKGTGIEHVKYSPANVFFNNSVSLKQNANIDDISDICPGNFLEKKANKIFLKEPYNCDLCRYCEAKTNHGLELVMNDNEFVFTIEPFGNLDLKTIINEASKYLLDELTELKLSFSLEKKKQETKKEPKKKRVKEK